ncbi:MAG: hypothetical protein DRJ05_19390, partial [Bacteroidetes bacterium]
MTKRGNYRQYFFAIMVVSVLLSSFPNAYGQLVINEICPRNSDVLPDEDNSFNDWFEILNTSDDPINLNGWYVSDNISNPEKWAFPSFILPPDSHLVVIADRENKKAIVDHWETIVHAEEIWKYWLPFENMDPVWKTLNYDDSLWLEGQGGFGRGDGDDNTILP